MKTGQNLFFMPFKQWKSEMAMRLGISFKNLERRLERGRLARPPLVRVNQRVIFVREQL